MMLLEFSQRFHTESGAFRRIFERLELDFDQLSTDLSLYEGSRGIQNCGSTRLRLRVGPRNRLVWLNNQLYVLSKQLDHGLMLPSTAAQLNQNALADLIKELIQAQQVAHAPPACRLTH